MARAGLGRGLAVGLIFALRSIHSVAAAPPPPPPIEAYGNLPSLDMVKLSPSGERYAFIGEEKGIRRVIIATIANRPLDYMVIGDVKVRDLIWADESHLMVVVSDTVELGLYFTVQAAELTTVIVRNIATHNAIQVFGGNHAKRVADTVRGVFGTAEIDGRSVGYFGGITLDHSITGREYLHHTYPDLYSVDLDSGDMKLVARGEEASASWLVDKQGQVTARATYNTRTGDWQILAGANGPALASGNSDFRGSTLHFGKSTDTVLVVIPRENENDFVEEIPLAGGSPQVYNENADLFFNRQPGLWIGTIERTEERHFRMFSPALQAHVDAVFKAFPKYRVGLSSTSDDFNRIVVRTEGSDDSGTYWLVDIGKHSADPLGLAYPEVKEANVGPTSMISWKAGDGLVIHGVLTLPPGRAPKGLPLVVLPHGGPEARDYPHFDWFAQAFAARGYAVLQPNFRGSSGYGKDFRNAGLGQWGRKMQTDISDGEATLAKSGVIDPKRACVVGASYGGYAALAGVTVQHGLYRCAVSVAGVADLSGFLRYEQQTTRTANAATRYWKAFMGVTSGWGSELDQISPAELAAQADAPILLVHGKKDTVVPYDQSETMESALKRAGKPVEFVTLDGEDHWLSRENTRIQMLKAAIAFVEKYNPPN